VKTCYVIIRPLKKIVLHGSINKRRTEVRLMTDYTTADREAQRTCDSNKICVQYMKYHSNRATKNLQGEVVVLF